MSVLSQIELLALPETQMTPHEQHGDILFFRSFCLSFILFLCWVHGYHRRPFGGVLSIRATPEHDVTRSVTRAYMTLGSVTNE